LGPRQCWISICQERPGYTWVIDLFLILSSPIRSLAVLLANQIDHLMSSSSHIQSILIGVEYQTFQQTLDVYLLFAILLGQIKSELNYRLVTYKLASL
jgi:hypothetical protein